MKTPEVIRVRDEKIEAQLPEYTLPQVLVHNNGERVTSEVTWEARRKEIVALFEEHMYGRNPEYTGGIEPRIAKEEHHKPEGYTEKTVHIRLDGGVTLRVAMQYPNDGEQHPFFVSKVH